MISFHISVPRFNICWLRGWNKDTITLLFHNCLVSSKKILISCTKISQATTLLSIVSKNQSPKTNMISFHIFADSEFEHRYYNVAFSWLFICLVSTKKILACTKNKTDNGASPCALFSRRDRTWLDPRAEYWAPLLSTRFWPPNSHVYKNRHRWSKLPSNPDLTVTTFDRAKTLWFLTLDQKN